MIMVQYLYGQIWSTGKEDKDWQKRKQLFSFARRAGMNHPNGWENARTAAHGIRWKKNVSQKKQLEQQV